MVHHLPSDLATPGITLPMNNERSLNRDQCYWLEPCVVLVIQLHIFWPIIMVLVGLLSYNPPFLGWLMLHLIMQPVIWQGLPQRFCWNNQEKPLFFWRLWCWGMFDWEGKRKKRYIWLHCVYLTSKGQGRGEWQFLRAFTITSTMCYAVLPQVSIGSNYIASRILGILCLGVLPTQVSHQTMSSVKWRTENTWKKYRCM